MRQIIFFGAGGHALDIYDIFQSCDGIQRDSNYIFLSDDKKYFNNKFDIVGNFEDVEVLTKTLGRCFFVIAVNNSKMREEIYNTYCKNNDMLSGIKVVHPTANVSESCKLPYGKADIIIGPHVSIGPRVKIGQGVHINSGVTINQSSVIGDWSTLSPGVNVCGDVEIGAFCQFGAGGVVINYKKIGDNVTVGSGSVIIDDVSNNTTVVGVPAKAIKTDGLIVWG